MLFGEGYCTRPAEEEKEESHKLRGQRNHEELTPAVIERGKGHGGAGAVHWQDNAPDKQDVGNQPQATSTSASEASQATRCLIIKCWSNSDCSGDQCGKCDKGNWVLNILVESGNRKG